MRLPFDTSLVPRETLGPEAKTHVKELIDRLKLVHEQAAKNTQITQEESKQKHDINAKESNFLLGEQVLLKINKRKKRSSKKLGDKFRGPFYIREKGPFDTYKIADCQTNKVIKNFINAKDLKWYYDPLNYRVKPPINEPSDEEAENSTEADSGDETIIYEPHLDIEPGQKVKNLGKNTNRPINSKPNKTNIEKKETKRQSQVENEIWYQADKILRQRRNGQRKEYLIEWTNSANKPSWQDESDVSDELKRQFYIRQTKEGKLRKRPYRYFDKSKVKKNNN